MRALRAQREHAAVCLEQLKAMEKDLDDAESRRGHEELRHGIQAYQDQLDGKLSEGGTAAPGTATSASSASSAASSASSSSGSATATAATVTTSTATATVMPGQHISKGAYKMAWEELHRLDAFSERTYPMDDTRSGYLTAIMLGMEAARTVEMPRSSSPFPLTVQMDRGSDGFAAQAFLR